ncbi:MAG TPA: hypothetical protein VKA82_15560 [Rubrobacter sp.]|nr:hypothetical protein [Rubrobacter sp.]
MWQKALARWTRSPTPWPMLRADLFAGDGAPRAPGVGVTWWG